MSRSAGVHDTLVYRLSQVLTKLNQGESLDPQTLADEFGVTLRTIQRDLNVRFACLPLVKTDGRYRLEQSQLGKLTSLRRLARQRSPFRRTGTGYRRASPPPVHLYKILW